MKSFRVIYYRLLVMGLLLSPFSFNLSSHCYAQLNTDRITAIGRNALYFDDYVLSIQYFNQIIKLKPYLAEPYLLRAIAKIQLGDHKGALRDLDASIERNPFQPGAYYTRGYVYRQLGELEKAEADFSTALHYSPENKTYMLLRADVLSAMERYEEAMADIDHLLRREPKSASLYFEKGVICMSKRDTLCAFDAFSETVKYDSQSPQNWSALGLINLIMDNENEALQDLTKSINLGSKWAGDYINRGIIFYRKHNYRGAISDYDKAVELAPNDAQSYYNRGLLRAEVGDLNRALEDFNTAIDLAPEQTELHYQRAVVLMQLKQWRQALADLECMIDRYPYFLPSYYLAAQAQKTLGNSREAYRLRYTASQLEAKKDSISAAQQDSLSTPDTDVHLAKAQPAKKDRRKEFSAHTAQNKQDPNEEKYTDSETRGAVQQRRAEVINEPNIVLSYYSKDQSFRRTNYFYYSVDELNNSHRLPAALKFTTQEVPLTADMVNSHFEQISQLSNRIDRNPNDPYLYFARAIEFALVQDYISAIDDCTRALQISNVKSSNSNLQSSIFNIITFCRANWRFKQLEFLRANGELTAESAMDFDIMLRDYDYVTQQQPDFAFAWYNKANMLCAQKNYKEAIDHYTHAIAADQDFAEAYFNRGLTRIYTDDVEGGISDLSKAGELGIYQAYNLITRFQ